MISDIILKEVKPEIGCRLTGELPKTNDSNILDLFFRADDYCIKNKFPTVDILERFADKLEGFYYKGDYKINSLTKAAFFNCSLTTQYKNHEVGELFLRNCTANIDAKDNSIVFVTAVGDCKIKTTGNVQVSGHPG